MFIFEFAKETHAGNVKAGWWTDLETGKSILMTRNRAELLMLTVTELSEGSIGDSNRENDDKLPQYPMLDVELADAVIRAGDLIGAEISVHNYTQDMFTDEDSEKVFEQAHFVLDLSTASVDSILMKLVNILSIATEHFRRQRHFEAVKTLYAFIVAVNKVSKESPHVKSSISEVIKAKIDFNAKREDHKIANRQKNGGKKF